MYIVNVLAPDGLWGYLSRGKRVRFENATHYYHPSGAKRAAESYRAKHGNEGRPTEAVVKNAKHLCSRCEYDFGEIPERGTAEGCNDHRCPINQPK